MKHLLRHLVLGTTALIGVGCSSSDSETLSAGELALQNAGGHLDGDGLCAAIAQINSACPPDLAWDNHGQYVSCVARYLSARVDAGDLDDEQKGALVSVAAQSSIGKKHGHGWPGFGACDGFDGGSGGAPGYPGDYDDDDHDDDDRDGGSDDDHGHGGAGDRDDDGHDHGGSDDGHDRDAGCGGSRDRDDSGADAGADAGWGGRPRPF